MFYLDSSVVTKSTDPMVIIELCDIQWLVYNMNQTSVLQDFIWTGRISVELVSDP